MSPLVSDDPGAGTSAPDTTGPNSSAQATPSAAPAANTAAVATANRRSRGPVSYTEIKNSSGMASALTAITDACSPAAATAASTPANSPNATR